MSARQRPAIRLLARGFSVVPTTLALLGAGWAGAAPVELTARKSVPAYTLKSGQVWRLECQNPKRFDASALHRLKDGTWITLDDKTTRLFRVEFEGEAARLMPTEHEFLPKRTARQAKAEFPPDPEGLAVDAQGRVYLSEESKRQILRYDPVTKRTEVLAIDWAPVRKWFSADVNASWEGVAVSPDKLFVANERSVGRIIVVDLASLKVERDFQVSPPGREAADVHYSDLCWHAGHLWVLCRESRCVLQVDVAKEKVLAEFGYDALERDPQNAYAHLLPYGFVEGLFVDDQNIWLTVDNNGFPRFADKTDRRPQLWKCPRPDRK